MAARDTEASSAANFLPDRLTLPALKNAAAGCRACPLWKTGTQTVFGDGRRQARLMLVGEQPGDSEDKEGLPFVGPAGRILDEGLAEAGIIRKDAYVTNVVKHFKFTKKTKKIRIHAKPSMREIRACQPWLMAEIEVVKPRVIVALGATAAQALFGKDARVTKQHGQFVELDLAPMATMTIQPSSILRQRSSKDRHSAMAQFVEDLKVVAKALEAG